MYLVTGKFDDGMHFKKLDRTEVDFHVSRSVNQELRSDLQAKDASAIIYKLEDWAKEWCKLIYDRNSAQLNLEKLGGQTTAMLKNQRRKQVNWFDLFNRQTSSPRDIEERNPKI